MGVTFCGGNGGGDKSGHQGSGTMTERGFGVVFENETDDTIEMDHSAYNFWADRSRRAAREAAKGRLASVMVLCKVENGRREKGGD
jgi:hypothetical protein